MDCLPFLLVPMVPSPPSARFFPHTVPVTRHIVALLHGLCALYLVLTVPATCHPVALLYGLSSFPFLGSLQVEAAQAVSWEADQLSSIIYPFMGTMRVKVKDYSFCVVIFH